MQELTVEEAGDPRRWYTTNLVGESSALLSSVDFNDHPRRLHIAATRATHRGLFELLREAKTSDDAADIFEHYMQLAFGVAKRRRHEDDTGHCLWKSSYLKLLQGWGFDANSVPGAVLKGWVESRFGIVPTFHHAPLGNFPSDAWMRYLEEKLSGRFHNNSIQMQLDVLYEYCQFWLSRFLPHEGPHVRLYRGIERSEACFLRGSVRERWGVLRFNNLVSFSISRERSETFGELILSCQVPLAKLLFYPGLVNDHVLNGEGEALVIGGDFEVKVAYV